MHILLTSEEASCVCRVKELLSASMRRWEPWQNKSQVIPTPTPRVSLALSSALALESALSGLKADPE